MSRTRTLIALLTLIAAATAVAVAQAATGIGPATSFKARFTTTHTASSTGLVLRTTGSAPAQGVSEAPAVQQTVTLPAGTTLKLSRLPQCKASDADIGAKGAEGACPAATRVGSGGADGLLDGTPTHFDVGIYSVRGHLVFAAERNGQPLKQAFNGIARGRKLILTVPTLDGHIAPTEFDAKIAAGHGKHAWLVTPGRCPRGGHWSSASRFQGVASPTDSTPVTAAQTLSDRSACRA
jgi:hypothetical protein